MTAVLLLNADFTPLKTVNLQRTLSLMLKDKVDILETIPNRLLRSPSVSIPFPSVIRLRYYAHVPKRRMVWSRRAVFARDGYTCQYCGRKLSRDEATLDHIIPVQKCKELGIKSSVWSNTCCSCPPCNLRKGSKTMRDAGMKFFNDNYEPKTPRTNYVIVFGNVPIEWKVYLGH